MADIISMARPKGDTEKDALYAYLLGAPTRDSLDTSDEKQAARLQRGAYAKPEHLPELVQQFEAFKKNPELPTPKLDFRMFTSTPLSTAKWREIALNGRWHFVRMNLATFQRHGVFNGKVGEDVAQKLAEVLRDEEQIHRSMVFPYQLFAAYNYATDIPQVLKLALQDAMELATKNVPQLPGKTWIFTDVSQSMTHPITGTRDGVISKMRIQDVAALVASSILRTSPLATVIPICTRLHTNVKLNPRDSVMTNAKILSGLRGGGTHLELGMQYLVKEKKEVDNVLFVTDNESWVGRAHRGYGHRYGEVLEASGSEACWQKIRAKNPNAKLCNLQIQPYSTTQVPDETGSVLNIGGFSDRVFTVIERFVTSDNANFWVEEIEKVTLG